MSYSYIGIMANFSRSSQMYQYIRTLGSNVLNVSQNSKLGLGGLTSARFMSLQKQFDEAKEILNNLSEEPGNETKLKIYGLFKQATVGAVNTKRPGMVDFIGRAKWDAWNSIGSISEEEAKQKYIELVNSLAKTEENVDASSPVSGQIHESVLVECDGALRKIILNRPKKMNALIWETYEGIITALKEADEDPKTNLTVLTGAGSYYCSGNDLSNFTNVTPDKMDEMAEGAKDVLQRFVAAFIDFRKPLIAVVNGPAVGVSVTTLGLFDAVYATDKATFNTPFTALGQSPEGCSSFIFPRLMGYGKASELLYFNKKVTAEQACQLGLVTEVFPDDAFQSEIWPRLREYSKLPTKSVIYSKELVRGVDREILHKVNDTECERLRERWVSDDCIKAIMAFFNRKK